MGQGGHVHVGSSADAGCHGTTVSDGGKWKCVLPLGDPPETQKSQTAPVSASLITCCLPYTQAWQALSWFTSCAVQGPICMPVLVLFPLPWTPSPPPPCPIAPAGKTVLGISDCLPPAHGESLLSLSHWSLSVCCIPAVFIFILVSASLSFA